jgi:TPR repeat protein
MKENIGFYLLFPLCVALAACSDLPKKNTIRIHDSSGFYERSSDFGSHDPSEAVTDADPEKRILSLEALAQKDPRAAYDLGLRFFRGDGVRQDSYQAIQWMRNAAERGNIDAQKALGRLYLTGLEEMGADPQEAQKWLRIAAIHGDKEADKLLDEAAEARKKETDYYRWKTFWRERFYHSWHSGYSYQYYWRYGRWCY